VDAGREGPIWRTTGRAFVRAAAAGAVVTFLLVVRPTRTTPASADFTPLTSAQATALLRRSTAQIMAFGCDLERVDGTAVAVAGGELLTNQHVVAGSRLVDVVGDDQATQIGGPTLAATAGDVATVAEPFPSLPPLALASADPDPGEAVRVAGYPSVPSGQRDPGFTVIQTTVVDYVPGAEVGQPWPVMRLDDPVRPGMSGGPVLDGSGRVVGIVFGNELPTGEALAVPASELRRLLGARSLVPVTC
jgi:S1-C subfamily serine protease